MDAEHTTSHMQTKTQIENQDDPMFRFVKQDIEGSVVRGGMESFVVEQSAAQKIGYGWINGLIGGEEDNTTVTLGNNTLNIMVQGESVFDQYTANFINSDKPNYDLVLNNILQNLNLPDTYKPYLKAYLKALYDEHNTVGETQTNAKYNKEVALKKILNHAKETFGGNTNLGYRMRYRRFTAARIQLLANTYLPTGEIKFPEVTFDTLKDIGQDAWIVTESKTLDQVTKELEAYAIEHDLNDIIIFNTVGDKLQPLKAIKDNEGNIIRDKEGNIKYKESYSSLKELYVRLKYLGYLEGKDYTVVDRVITKTQGSKSTVYISDIKWNHSKNDKGEEVLTQTYAYVKGIRSPVQDYNATPVLKITGVVEHDAVEGNAAMYLIMGADNDGDTAAFLACKHTEVEGPDGVFFALDATRTSNVIYKRDDSGALIRDVDGHYERDKEKEEFMNQYSDGFYDRDRVYDGDNVVQRKGYLDVLMGDLNLTKDDANAVNLKFKAYSNYAHIGKKSTANSRYKGTIENGTLVLSYVDPKDPKATKGIRKGDAHYTLTEMLASMDMKVFEQIKQKAKGINLKTFEGSETDEMFWVESHIWIYSDKQNIPSEKGYNENFWKDDNQIKKYYEKYKNEIYALKELQTYLTTTKEGQNYVKQYFEDMLYAAHFATLVRGRVSKDNVGYTGGLRKDINLGSLLGVFPYMNKDKNGYIWKDLYGLDIRNEKNGIIEGITLEQFSTHFISNIFDWSKEELKELRNDTYASIEKHPSLKKHLGKLDYINILQFIAEHVLEYKIASDSLEHMIKVFNPKVHPTYEDVYNLLSTDEILDSLQPLLQYAEEHKKEQINNVHLALLKTYYLSRFVNRYYAICKENDNNSTKIKYELLKGFKEQPILTRLTSKILNDTIQLPISLSKHGLSLGNYTKVHLELRANADNLKEKLSKNIIAFGNGIHHIRFFAMGNEYDIYERRKIKYDVSQTIKNLRSKQSQKLLEDVKISRSDVEGDLKRALDTILRYHIFRGFYTNTQFTQLKKSFITFTKILSENIKKNNGLNVNILNNTELVEAVQTFELYGVPIYNLIKGTDVLITKYLEARRMSSTFDTPEMLKHLTCLMYLKGINKKELRTKLKNIPENAKYVLRYIIEADNPIKEQVSINADGIEEIEVEQDEYNFKEFTMFDTLRAASEQFNIQDFELPIKNTVDSETLNEYLKSLNFKEIENTIEVDEFVKDMIAQLQMLNKVREDYNKELNTDKPKYTLQDQIRNIVYDNKSYKAINNIGLKSTSVYTEISKLENKINKTKDNLTKKQDELNNKKRERTAHDEYSKALEGVNPTNTKTYLEKELDVQKEKLNKYKSNKIKYALIKNIPELSKVLSLNYESNNIDVLTKEDIKTFENQLHLELDKLQHPFYVLVDTFSTNKNGQKNIDFKGMYKFINKYYDEIRITQLAKAEESEGLAKRLLDYISVEDNTKYLAEDGKTKRYKELNKKDQKKYKKEHLKNIKNTKAVETWEDLISLNEIINLNGKKYTGVAGDLKGKILQTEFITPTLKQVKIKSWQDLEKIWNIIKANPEEANAYGFAFKNDIMDGIQRVYKPYQLTGAGRKIALGINAFNKIAMRLGSGFILRNIADVINQLWTDMKINLRFIKASNKEILRYSIYGLQVYDVYKVLSDERMATLLKVLDAYKALKDPENYKPNDIELQEFIKGQEQVLLDILKTYIEQGKIINNPSKNLKNRISKATELYELYKSNKLPLNYYDRVSKFILNMNFAEYVEFFDLKYVEGKPIKGFALDATKDVPETDHNKRIRKLLNNPDPLFKQILIEISAVMQTNAQADLFKEKQYKELFEAVEQIKVQYDQGSAEISIAMIEKQIEDYKKQTCWFVRKMSAPKKLWQIIVGDTETLARILGFIYNKHLYGKSFDESTQISLRNWFNYGQRSPWEIQMMYDIPYISFPLRSINNWSRRLLDPRYARFMDDIIDGVYGQYADEDGQYNEYEEFMIKNGWVPMAATWGLRLGSGAFDIQNIMTDPAGQIEQRRNPILKGLSEFINTGDLTQAVNQLAITGKLKQASQFITAGAYNVSKKQWGTPKVQRMFTATFEYNNYEKYTPRKYNYLYNGNGRYKYYENIYRDWFTKYGRMRKPTVDPVQLVKNIQWKQFLKRMQHKYRR